QIEGRTKFQKMAYLANLVGWSALDFRYHNYGPYSETLAVELEGMRNNGWIREEEVPTALGKLYNYSFDTSAKKIRQTFVGKLLEIEPTAEKMVKRTRGLMNDLSKFSSEELEIMA